MKLKNVIYTCAMMCMFFVQNGLSQGVELVKYQIRYNTSTCLWDCYLIIQQGAATTAGERLQANAQYSLVTQAGATLTIVQNYMPLNGNQTYTGTIPLKWNISSVVNAPAVTPTKKYFGITPSLSPSSFYNDLAAGDTIRLFSVSITPTTQCGANIWLFRNGIDPSSSAPGMAGGDFSNGFSVGSPDDVYNGNLSNVNPPKPVLSAVTACSAGLEIDLTASTSACQSPLTYAWSGPAGYTSTTQDVTINPATLANAGQYKVVVTDTRGCRDSIQLDAQVKPSAGADVQACAGGTATLAGTDPATGTWSALGTNASGATLTPTTPGNATVDFSSTASGQYKFIYTAGPCSDTMSVNVILPDAGPNPTDVGCFASGTASMSAVGVGTWSVSPMSAGTAIIADPSNPNTTVSGFSSLGTYFLVWTVGTCTDIAQIVVGDNCTCLITGNSVASVIPNTFCGTSGIVNLDGGAVAPAGGVYTWQQSLNNGSYSAAPGLNTLEDYQTPSLSTGVYRFRRTYFLAGDPPCNDTSNVILITVNASPAAPTPLTANPNPICLGTSVALTASNNVGATYSWSASSANAGLVSTTTNSTTMNPLSSGIYTISVTQTIAGCISPPASVTVTANSVPPTPSVSTVTSTNPTACNSSTGSIFFSGLMPNTAYQFDYRKNNVVQSAFLAANNLGVLELSGQSQGSYTNFMFTNADGCASGIYAGPVVLADPSAPDAPADLAADPNPTCANKIVTLTVTNTPGATYNWTASSPNAGLINSTTSTATMLPSLSGFYDVSVTQTIAGCTSAPSNIGISINDTPPTPTAGTVSAVNPTGCGLATGSIRISGLQNLTAYTVTYNYNAVPNTVNATTSNTGILTIPGLASGTYTSFVVTNISGCSSGTYLGPVNLVDPSTPSAPVGLTAVPNPVCLGSSVNLSVTNTVGATYTWTATPVGNGLVTTTGSSTTMLPTLVGVYNINVTQTIAGCTSLPATTTVTVNPTPPTPTAGTVSFVNPAVCGASTGSISFSGLLNNTAYTILYTRNGNASTANVTSNGSGVAIITGLNAATYAAFRIQNAVGCTSGTYAGPVTLLDPSAPTAPSNLTANPNPVCPGISVALAVTINAGATYTWSASSPSAGLVSSVTNTTTMSTLTSGLYTISVTQTVAGCTSPASSMQVTVNPAPPTPTAGTVTSTNPSVCAGNDGTISLSGLLASTLYTINYTKNGNPLSAPITTNGAGTAVLTGLNAGSYSNFSITNGAGCSSGTYTGSISLSDPNSPAAPSNLTAIPNPACIGTNVSLSVTNNVGAVYAWSSSSTNAVLSIANSTVNTNDMVATAAGSYTISVTQNVAGCTSPPATVIVIVNPTPPTLGPANVASTNPTTCGGSQGSILLSGLPAATTYTVNYFKNGNAVSSIITTDGSGNATINGLTAGTYANFTLAGAGNCPGGTYTGSVNLTDPPIPSAPSGLTALPNPACLGVTVNLNVTNNVGAVYNWSASSPNAGLVASVTNATTMLATVAGNYNISVTQMVAGCLSASSNIQVVINPVPSTPLVGNIVPANPTSCLGTDGSLAISGYLANTSYSVEYTKNGSPVLINLTSDGAGVLLISNLTAGVYSDFKVTNTFGCSSLILTAQITLSDPPAQGIPANLTALPNPSCLGTPVNLSVTNEVGATYAWSISSVDGGLNAGSTSTASMIAVTSGVYTVSVTKTVSGCISSPATLDIIVNAPPVTPDSNNFSTINPTCGNSNGSISINGLLSNQSYSIDFIYNSNSLTRIITVDGTGVGVLSGFAAGIFSNFTITNAQGCTSGLYAGPIELTDPGSPSAPTGLITTPDQICIRSTINISVNNNPAASYAWSVSDIGAGLQFSSVNNTMMLPTAPGIFTVSVTQTVNGCISPPATVVLEVKADCYNPDFDVTFANIPLTGDVSTNDVTLDMKTYMAITAASGNPSACLPVLAADGTYTFNCGVTGRFNYTVTVCHGISTTFCVSVPLVITVLEPLVNNNPPIANSDYIRTKTATPIRLNVLQNDKCQSASNCTLDPPTIIVNPLHGTYNPTTMMYTPGASFIGTDSLLYQICQNPVVTPTNCQQAWAYILVVGNSSPNVTNAMDDYGQTQLNTPLIVNAANGLKMNDTDPEGDQQLITPMNVVIANKGAFIVQNDGSYIFTPVTGYIGPVDCPYEICDNNQDVACDIATIHLLVEPSLPDGTIGNRVWHDQNGDGVQNGSEPGIAGVQVKLYTASKTLVATKTTSSIGEYSFTNVRPGSYYLQFVAPVGYDFTFANRGDDAFDSDVISGILKGATAVFEVRGGDVNNSYDAGMYKCSRIGDKVWYDLNKNDVWNTNENGINEIQVVLWRNHFGVWLVWDDTRTKPKPGSPSDDGHYEFCAPPGQYYVEVVMPPLGLVQALPNRGNNPLIDSDLTNNNGIGTTNSFSLTSGQNKLDLGAGFYPMATAGNLVWMDLNQNGVQETNEPKVEGVKVEAFDAETHDLVGDATTDVEGAYRIAYLQKKEIYFKFDVPAYYSATVPTATTDNMDSDVDHSFGPNTTRRISMQSGLENVNIDMGIMFGVLPVDWLYINAKRKDKVHHISWATQKEVNVSHYQLERRLSKDGDFEVIGDKIVVSESNNQIHQYETYDFDTQASGLYYYRVKQVDFDGKYTYSDVVYVSFTGETDIVLYPSPAVNESNLEINLELSSTVDVKLFDSSSRLIQSVMNTTLEEGGHTVKLDLNGLHAGVYNVVITINGQKINKKLIKIE